MAEGVRMNVSPAQAAFLIRVLGRGIRGEQAVVSYELTRARELITKAQVFAEAGPHGEATTDLQAGTGRLSAPRARLG